MSPMPPWLTKGKSPLGMKNPKAPAVVIAITAKGKKHPDKESKKENKTDKVPECKEKKPVKGYKCGGKVTK